MKVMMIGAGVGGLCAALLLEKQGIEVAIYERSPEVRADGAGLSIWANALRVLDYIGVGAELRASSMTQLKGGIHTAKGAILSQAENDMRQIETTLAIVLHRADLHEALLKKLQSPIYTGKEFSRYAYSADRQKVLVHFSDGSVETADVLIGADGLHSKVRLQMQPKTLPVYSGYGAWRGVVNFEHRKVGHYWGESWGQGQRFGITPIGKDRIYWFATNNLPAEKRFTGAESKAHLLRCFADWHDPIPELLGATAAESILYHPISDIDPLSSWVDARVALLGDAAHAMTPNMGQGACQAIEDAYALAWAVGHCADTETALKHYETARRERAISIMSRSRQIGKVAQVSNPVLAWLRDTAVRLLPNESQEKALNAVISYDIIKTLA